jgi:hypothetical protein
MAAIRCRPLCSALLTVYQLRACVCVQVGYSLQTPKHQHTNKLLRDTHKILSVISYSRIKEHLNNSMVQSPS